MFKNIGAGQRSFPSAHEVFGGDFDIFAAIGFHESMQLRALLLTAQNENSPIQFLHVNCAFTALCGYAPEEAVGQTRSLPLGKETDIGAALHFRRNIEQNGSGFATLINYRKDHSACEAFLLGAKV